MAAGYPASRGRRADVSTVVTRPSSHQPQDGVGQPALSTVYRLESRLADPHTNLQGQHCYHPHYTEEETEADQRETFSGPPRRAHDHTAVLPLGGTEEARFPKHTVDVLPRTGGNQPAPGRLPPNPDAWPWAPTCTEKPELRALVADLILSLGHFPP